MKSTILCANRSMNKLKSFVLLVALAWCSSAAAENLRGRVDRPGTYGPVPAVGLPVIAISMDYEFERQAITGRDGMYYIYNVPPGNYVLEVLDPTGHLLRELEVFVVPGRYMTDVPPVLLR